MQKTSKKSVRFLQPYRVIFRITLEQIFFSKKSMLTALLVTLPVLISVVYRFTKHPPIEVSGFFSQIMIFMYLMFLSILLALLYATSIIADEVDNKTITYLFTRPIRKDFLILSKFFAYLLGSMGILFISALITFLIVTTDSRMPYTFGSNLVLFLKYLGVLTIALIAYGAVFTFLGTSIKRPVLVGLFFAFGWEPITVVIPGLIKKFSVIHYLLSAFPNEHISRAIIAELFKGTTSRPVLSVIILFIISIVFLSLSVFIVYRRDFSRFD